MIRTLCIHMGMAYEAIDLTWKQVDRSSERQFGAFVFLYAAHTKTAPELWDNKLTEVRNKVVHKGHFASSAAATTYGEECYERIHAIARVIRDTCPVAWNDEHFRQIRERLVKQADGGAQATTTSPVYVVIDRPVPAFAVALNHFFAFNSWRRHNAEDETPSS